MIWSEEAYREMEEEILLFIYQYRLFTGQAPAQREMAEALAISRYRVRKLLARLSEKELIERAAGVPRGIDLTEDGRERASRQNQLQALPAGAIPYETLMADAYVPEEVRVGHAFRVRVLVRPNYRQADPPRREEAVESERVHIMWPADEQVELAIAIRAAACRIVGPDRRYVHLRRGHASVPVSFQLIPRQEGEIVIDVDVLERHDEVTYGTVAARTVARREAAGAVHLKTHSHVVERVRYEPAGPLKQVQKDYTLLRSLLLNCGPFASDAELHALFVDPRLQPWRDVVPGADSPAARVAGLLDLLHDRTHSQMRRNALVIFLDAVADQIPPEDLCHQQLRLMAEHLTEVLTSSGERSPFATLFPGEGMVGTAGAVG